MIAPPQVPRRTITQFCDHVCQYVRFHPDHEAIRAELAAHMEDHAAALMARGVHEEEAAQQAVAAMGDPEEIGKELDKSHSPLLGWFQIWFRRAVWCLAALALLASLPQAGDIVTDLAAPPKYDGHIAHLLEHYEEYDVIADYTPGAVGRYRDYAFSVPRAIVVRSSSDGTLTLRCLLEVSHPNPWQRRPEFMDGLWAEDDLGSVYSSEGQAAPDQFSDILSGGDLTRSYFFASYYGLWVAQIPPEAASVTLHFDRYGEDVLSFTLPLKGGT